MRIGGGGRESWMVLLPIALAIGVSTILLGGPDQALTTLEHMAYDAWAIVERFFRR